MNLLIFYKPALLSGIAVIWFLMISSKFAEYDTNIFLAGLAFLISIIITLNVFFVQIFRKEFFKKSSSLAILFLFTSSPIALYSFIEFYTEFIGQFHKF